MFKFIAYSGLVFWALLSGLFLLGLILKASGSKIAADGEADVDSAFILVCLLLSIAGAALSAGLAGRRLWAYRVAVAVLAFAAIVSALVSIGSSSPDVTRQRTVWVGATVGACGLCLFWVAARSKGYFGPPATLHRTLAAPGWLNLALAIASAACALWPQPTPMFGIWMSAGQFAFASVWWAAAYAAVGWGLLTHRCWTKHMVIALTVLACIWMAGWAWDPNPDSRLPQAETPTRWNALCFVVLGLIPSGWTLWCIRIFERMQQRVEEPQP